MRHPGGRRVPLVFDGACQFGAAPGDRLGAAGLCASRHGL